MSSHSLKTLLIPTAAAIAVVFGSASAWAQASEAAHPDISLAMMDMDEMAKMKKMDKMDKKPGMAGMAGMADKKMKGKMPMAADAAMPDAADSTQDPMAAPANSDMMGRMRGPMQGRPGMKNMAPTGLPGFAGASHLYHVGATGFFLDHPQHIALSTAQQTALNRIKEKSSLDGANSERRVEDSEQELWTLTSAEAPDAAKIDTKVRAIETLRGDQRLAFIRAVGEAGKVLTAEQQAAVLGTGPMTGNKAPSATGKPAPMKME